MNVTSDKLIVALGTEVLTIQGHLNMEFYSTVKLERPHETIVLNEWRPQTRTALVILRETMPNGDRVQEVWSYSNGLWTCLEKMEWGKVGVRTTVPQDISDTHNWAEECSPALTT